MNTSGCSTMGSNVINKNSYMYYLARCKEGELINTCRDETSFSPGSFMAYTVLNKIANAEGISPNNT